MSKHGGSGDLALLLRILREARPYGWHIALVFVLGLLATPLSLLQPVPLKLAVDNVIGSDPLPGVLEPFFTANEDGYGPALLVAVAIMQVLVVLFAQIRSVANSILETYVTEKLTLRVRAKLLAQAQRLSFAFHDTRGTADAIYRIQYDATAIASVSVKGITSFVSSAFALVSIVCVMIFINLELAILALCIVPLLFLLTQQFRVRMKRRYKDAKRLESSALGLVQEVLTAFRVVKAYGREEHEEGRFVHHSTKGVSARIRLGLFEGLFGLMISTTTAAGTAAVLYVGARQVQQGHLTLGDLVMVIAYLTQLYGPVQTMSKRVASAQKHFVGAQRAFDLLDEVPDVVEAAHARAIERARGAIEFRHVSFGYQDDDLVLEDVSFAVEPGTKVGIVARTGAGKTTLASLMTRFYDPCSGAILLDGVDLRDYRLADLRDQFSIVLQEPVLFSTTIADNIGYSCPDAGMDEIVAAAKAAGAHDFVSALHDGYDTVVGERGMRLSGGERQRISLARAFLKDAPILILDEPTSSVDVQTEAEIMSTTRRLMQGRTTFLITHRPGTLAEYEAVLRIQDGHVTIEPTKGAGNSRQGFRRAEVP